MRRSELKPSRGTVWPPAVARAIEARDGRCVGPLVGMPLDCEGPAEKDHIRAGGMGMKSPSTLDNGVLLCSNVHHPLKTRQGRIWRPVLVQYVQFMAGRVEHAHVEPVRGCPECEAIVSKLVTEYVAGWHS